MIFNKRSNIKGAVIVLVLSFSDYFRNSSHVSRNAVGESLMDGEVGRIVQYTVETLCVNMTVSEIATTSWEKKATCVRSSVANLASQNFTNGIYSSTRRKFRPKVLSDVLDCIHPKSVNAIIRYEVLDPIVHNVHCSAIFRIKVKKRKTRVA